MPRGPGGRSPPGGQGVAREGESGGLEEKFRAVVELDEPVGQSQGEVELALWQRRRLYSPWRTKVCAGGTERKTCA